MELYKRMLGGLMKLKRQWMQKNGYERIFAGKKWNNKNIVYNGFREKWLVVKKVAK